MRPVLLITYYFPPAGGVAVQRMLKFARYLPQYGYLPTVVTVDPRFAVYGAMDSALMDQLPGEVRVVRTRSWDPFSIYARMQGVKKEDVAGVGFVKEGQIGWRQEAARWVRGNIFLPDARVGWVPFARRAVLRLVREQKFSVVMTSGPPHSAHLVGSFLKARTGIPWIADLRDPWTDYYYNAHFHQSPLARFINARLERRVLSRADVVLSVSEAIGTGLRGKVCMRRYETVPNGYDPHDTPSGLEPANDCARFVIAHVGTYSKERHSAAFVQVIVSMAEGVELRLVGHVHEWVANEFGRTRLGESLVLIPHVPHREAMEHMAQADMLLLPIERGRLNKGIVSGKLFEYLSVGKPVIGIGPPDGDMARILRETRAGIVFDYDDAKGMQEFILEHRRRCREGKPFAPANDQALRAYDRRALTQRLADIIGEIAEDAPT